MTKFVLIHINHISLCNQTFLLTKSTKKCRLHASFVNWKTDINVSIQRHSRDTPPGKFRSVATNPNLKQKVIRPCLYESRDGTFAGTGQFFISVLYKVVFSRDGCERDVFEINRDVSQHENKVIKSLKNNVIGEFHVV